MKDIMQLSLEMQKDIWSKLKLKDKEFQQTKDKR